MRPTLRIEATLACVATLLASMHTAASADTATKKDRRGDAPAQIDVTKTTYTYDTTAVSVEARVPGLGRTGEASLSVSQFEVFEAGYVARIQRSPGKAPKVGLFYFDHFNLEKRKCAGVEGTWQKDRIRISVPVSCLLTGFPADQVLVRFGMSAGGHVDRAPAVKRLAQTP